MCWSRANPAVLKLEEGDASDSDWQCLPVDELELAARGLLAIGRAFKYVKKLPPPFP